MKKNIFIWLAILGCMQVQAQERWSLRQCIDYAIEHNIDIRRTANVAEQSSIEVNTAKWARTPEPQCQCRAELELGTVADCCKRREYR